MEKTLTESLDDGEVDEEKIMEFCRARFGITDPATLKRAASRMIKIINKELMDLRDLQPDKFRRTRSKVIEIKLNERRGRRNAVHDEI